MPFIGAIKTIRMVHSVQIHALAHRRLKPAPVIRVAFEQNKRQGAADYCDNSS
jgi:hypothetical protein